MFYFLFFPLKCLFHFYPEFTILIFHAFFSRLLFGDCFFSLFFIQRGWLMWLRIKRTMVGGLFFLHLNVFHFPFPWRLYEVMEIRRIDVVAFELCWRGETFSLHNYINKIKEKFLKNSCCAMSYKHTFLWINWGCLYSKDFSKFPPLKIQLKFQWLQWEKRWILFSLIFICYAIYNII